MSTKVIRRTTCGTCGAQTEHDTPSPGGWGRISFNTYAASGYVVGGRESDLLCPPCMAKVKDTFKALFTAVKP